MSNKGKIIMVIYDEADHLCELKMIVYYFLVLS